MHFFIQGHVIHRWKGNSTASKSFLETLAQKPIFNLHSATFVRFSSKIKKMVKTALFHSGTWYASVERKFNGEETFLRNIESKINISLVVSQKLWVKIKVLSHFYLVFLELVRIKIKKMSKTQSFSRRELSYIDEKDNVRQINYCKKPQEIMFESFYGQHLVISRLKSGQMVKFEFFPTWNFTCITKSFDHELSFRRKNASKTNTFLKAKWFRNNYPWLSKYLRLNDNDSKFQECTL